MPGPDPDPLPGLPDPTPDPTPDPGPQPEPESDVVDPVARVLVDTPLAHLDRPFDYEVPADLAATAVPGSRVRVRFAGRLVNGFVLERCARAEHDRRLAPLQRSVSAEVVLTPEVVRLLGALAERYAGTRADLLRLAVPKRHAATEKAAPVAPAPALVPATDAALEVESGRWPQFADGAALLASLRAGGSPRAVWQCPPGEEWPDSLARAALAAYRSGRGALLLAPDRRDLDRLEAAVRDVLGDGHHVVLSADAGPARRYREFLTVSRGARRVVLGTRAAAFAPVADLGLVAMWDDGDDLYAEPRAPYPHAREVLLTRAHQQGAGVLLGGYARSVEASGLVTSGWARDVLAPRDLVRRVRVTTTGTDAALARDPLARASRTPKEVHTALRSALDRGRPVLVQTPRHGYAPGLACERCRTPARCAVCTGPLRLGGATRPPHCGWCGVEAGEWRCPVCGHHGLRAPVVGDARTAEELGRTFPGVAVVTSSGSTVRDRIGPRSQIVVATPGAEPVAEGGYGAVVLLDTWLPLSRAGLRVEEEALRRWFNAGAMVAPGGQVLAVGEPGHPALQALLRWDPAGFAEREAEQRAAAHLPPAARVASISGTAAGLEEALALLPLPAGAEVLGPMALDDDRVRVIVRVPRRNGADLSRALGEMQRQRSARKLEAVRVQVDPADL